MSRGCPNSKKDSPHYTVRNGSFWSKDTSKRIQRYRCLSCGRSFSQSTFKSCFGQKKRRLNPLIRKLLCSGNSFRKTARLLQINRKTVSRKLLFLASEAKASTEEYLESLRKNPVEQVYFDELETIEKTNCKPLSIGMCVSSERKILGFRVARFRPRTPRLARISQEKYGYREDERRDQIHALFKELSFLVQERGIVHTDEHAYYSKAIREYLPRVKHRRSKSRRATIVGNGELKEKGFDPLFPINQTFATLRDNVSRLIRRTWSISQSVKWLEEHLSLYMAVHNQAIERKLSLK